MINFIFKYERRNLNFAVFTVPLGEAVLYFFAYVFNLGGW